MSKNELSRRDFLKAMAAGSVAAAAVNIVPLTSTVAAQDMMYNEAPMLTALVDSGDLPPVEERIPSNPRVITPYNEIGEYGGTWRRAHKGLSDRWGPTKLQEEMIIEWYAPDPDTLGLEANYISEWVQNDDATEFTFTLRDGLKWSDGAPFTTEDVQFYYDLASADPPIRNPEAHYVSGGKLMGLEIVDALTWKISFAADHACQDGQRCRWRPGYGDAQALSGAILGRFTERRPGSHQRRAGSQRP
jgi:peptide/nickel transport system substrate-binding protein